MDLVETRSQVRLRLLIGLLVLLPPFYVYRVPVIGVEPFRLLQGVLFAWATYCMCTVEWRLRPRHGLAVVLLAVLAAIPTVDLVRAAEPEMIGRNLGNHLASLFLIPVIVFACTQPGHVFSVMNWMIAGSVGALALAGCWVVTGRLPLEFLVNQMVGTETSLADVTFSDAGRLRLAAGFFDPNFYGMYLVVVIAFILNRLAWGDSRKWPLSLLLVLNVVALVLTMSRTSMIGMILVLAITAVLAPRLRRTIVAVVFVAAFAFPVLLANGVLPDALVVLERFSNLQDRAGRLLYHQAGLDAFLASPLFGAGTEGLLWHVRQYQAVNQASAHIVYLSWLARFGIVGTLVYLAFLAIPPAVATFGRQFRQDIRHLVLATYIPLAVMYVAYDYFDSLPAQYVVFGLGWAVVLNGLGWVHTESRKFDVGGSTFVD